VTILLLADAVHYVAMLAIAGLLIVVGVGTVKPSRIISVARTGRVPLTVMILSLVLTMVIPLQYSVLVGVVISVLLFVVDQSSRLVTSASCSTPTVGSS
jgi:SulP family sulfate permease